MRLLTRKIHRAFPELDKFDDDVCKRYMQRAKRLQNAWKFLVMLLIALPISLVLWFSMMFATGYILNEYFYDISFTIETIALLFVGTGIAWMPAFTALLIRDRWLHRCLRKQLTGVQCPTCGYSLIGLSLLADIPAPTVHCPECGHTTALKNLGLSPADIDPTLLSDEPRP